MLSDEIRYQILKAVEENPKMNQRELAEYLGVSLGKTNYCLKKLIEKGLVKVGDFKTNPDKRTYAYLLTPNGVKEKSKVAMRFLKQKIEEYKVIKREIENLRLELGEER